MTFIMAHRFDKRILLVADTKISDRSGVLRRTDTSPHANNYVPGRLKIFPIGLHLSVGYAGNSGKALNDLRRLKNSLEETTPLAHCLHALQSSSADGEVDYLLISHLDGPEIYKITNAQIACGHTVQWIGDGEVVPLVVAAMQSARERREMSGHEWTRHPEYGSCEEHDLSSAWVNLLLTGPTLTASVGGIPMQLLASPYGHSFLTTAGVYNPGPFIITANGAADEAGDPINPVEAQYSYSIVHNEERGAPVAGLWLQEGGRAYIYDPMAHDDPVPVLVSDGRELSALVKERALNLGGKVIELPPLR